MEYMVLFSDKGERVETHPIDNTLTEEQKQALIDQGFIAIPEKDWAYYVGNMGGGDNGTGYIRDPKTGKPVSAPAYVPTREERATILFNECQADLKEIDAQIMNAIVLKDTELIEELRRERDDRVAEYEAALEELEGGED